MIKSALRAAILLFVSLPLSAQAALQPGESVPLPAAAMLQTRPVADSDVLAPVAAGAKAELVSHSYNSSGSWWYVRVDGKEGWLPESALVPAALAAPIPAPPPAEPPAVPAAPPALPAPPVAPVAAAATSPVRARALTAAGSRELELGLDISRTKFSSDFGESSINSASALAKLGYCVTDRHEWGGLAAFGKFKQDSVSQTFIGLGPFYTLNLPSPPSNVVPYMGLSARYQREKFEMFGDSTTIKGSAYEVWLGARVFAGENVSVNISAYHERASRKYEGIRFDDTTTGLRVGLSGFLR